MRARRVHIFNPSAFSLALFSLVLIATNTTHLTWGPEIASTLSLAPHIYVFLFLVGLVVMYFFSVTLVAASAAAVLFGLSALYASLTGVPYFLDSEIPSAVFLGLHLLVTDPSTSPRTPLGRLVFGVLYGLGVFGLYSLLGAIGAPTFYDKLLCVPLLNLSVPAIDRAVRSIKPGVVLNRLALDGPLGRGNLAHMAVWIVFFGDDDGHGTNRWQAHRRQPAVLGAGLRGGPPERLQAPRPARDELLRRQLGMGVQRGRRPLHRRKNHECRLRLALDYFSRACELRFQAGCVNLLDPSTLSEARLRGSSISGCCCVKAG